MSLKVTKYLLNIVVAIVMLYFFYLQLRFNWDTIITYHFVINFQYIIFSFLVMTVGFLLETYMWQICMNQYLQQKLSFMESLSLVSISNLFKYIPGRFWAYTVQISLMSKKNISKSQILYVNLVCLLCMAMVSAIYGFYYLLFYLKFLPMQISLMLLLLLIGLDIGFIFWNTKVINWLFIKANTFLKSDVQKINIKKRLILYIQFICLIAWLPAGISAYLCSKGISLHIEFSDIFALISSMSVSWIIGYISIFTPSGLGVREGVMLLMLKQFSNLETALILPIVMRLVNIIIELLIGIIGVIAGLRKGYFTKDKQVTAN